MSAHVDPQAEAAHDVVRDHDGSRAGRRDGGEKLVVPWWLTAVVVIETLPMFIGPIAALFFPSSMPGLTGGEGVGLGSMLYAARNLSVGVALIVAYRLKSGPMLFVLILIRLLTDLVDLPSLLFLGRPASEARVSFIFVAFYFIPALVALRYLWRRISIRGGGEARS